MTALQTLIIILLIATSSCNNGKINTTLNSKVRAKDSSLIFNTTDKNETNIISDTIKSLLVDDYPVTNEMLEDKTRNNYSYKRKSGEIFSLDKAWFTNDTLQQTLVFEVYTDYHRLQIFHFLNGDIPTDLIKQMQLDVSKSKFDNVFDSATFKQKQKYFSGFINSAIQISQHYFTTKKSFKLGDKKEKAISAYGNPEKCSTSDNIEKCQWKFEGDYIESEEAHSKMKTDKPIAKDSYGYSVTMFFHSDKLIAMIISNDIP